MTNQLTSHGLPQIDYDTDWDAWWNEGRAGDSNYQKITRAYICDPDQPRPCNQKRNRKDDLDKIYEVISDLVGADCWAVTVDNDILYNQYDSEKTIRDRIIDGMVRDQIIKTPHARLLVHLFRARKPAVVNIYMFGQGANSGVYQIKWYPKEKQFCVTSHFTIF